MHGYHAKYDLNRIPHAVYTYIVEIGYQVPNITVKIY